jgi:ectoine hydroxylase-related dioxygenase (phytanoyl-CoA dioxygenase family)
MQQATVTLTKEQIESYNRNGYLTIPAITTAEEIEHIQGIYDKLFAEKAGREVGYQFDLASADEDDGEELLPQIMDPVKYAPELENTLFRANSYAIAAQLLGPEAEYFVEHAIRKPPAIGAETPWHQDEAYWDAAIEYDALSVWMPLQEATVENGCMQFIPGTNTMDVVPHHSIGHDPRVHGLEADSVDTSRAVACPIPAGGATVHHCRTIHYAGPNRTDDARRAYISVFMLPPVKREVPRDFYWNTMKRTAREERSEAAQKDS